LRGAIDVKLSLELEIEGQRRNGTTEYVGIIVICGETGRYIQVLFRLNLPAFLLAAFS